MTYAIPECWIDSYSQLHPQCPLQHLVFPPCDSVSNPRPRPLRLLEPSTTPQRRLMTDRRSRRRVVGKTATRSICIRVSTVTPFRWQQQVPARAGGRIVGRHTGKNGPQVAGHTPRTCVYVVPRAACHSLASAWVCAKVVAMVPTIRPQWYYKLTTGAN